MENVTKAINKEMDQLDVCRGKSLEPIQKLGAKFKEEALEMENRLLTLVEPLRQETPPRARFADPGEASSSSNRRDLGAMRQI
eukprot:2035936-Karenia_brevis.AAC.1